MADDPSLEIEAASPVELEPLRQQLTAWQQRLLALLEVLLCSSLPTQVLIANILGTIGIAPRIGDQLSLTFVFALSLTDTVVLIALMVALSRAHGDSPWLLWRGRPPLAGEILVGLMLVPVAVFIVAFLIGIIRTFVPGLHNVVENPLEALATGGAGGAAMFAVVAIVAGGIREELQRAFLLRRFERHLGGETVGVIVLSTAFGLGHALQGWDAAIATGALGAFWAILYLRRRSSVAPIISHAGFNSIEVFRVAIGGGA
ncbi:MAG TPA: type II CAAX endopeptidase family protein [Vicinamibacterales bacterium]